MANVPIADAIVAVRLALTGVVYRTYAKGSVLYDGAAAHADALRAAIDYLSDHDRVPTIIQKLHAERDHFIRELRSVEEKLVAARAELADLQCTFNLWWKADHRAIEQWQEAHPGNDLVWPDRCDMVVWLLDQLDEVKKGVK